MKLKYILAAGVVALLAGCDESRFLDTKPQGTLNDDLLSSAEGVELLVTSAYAGLKGPNRDMHWVPMTNWTYGEVRSDNAYKGGGGVNDGDFCTLLETFKIDATWANAGAVTVNAVQGTGNVFKNCFVDNLESYRVFLVNAQTEVSNCVSSDKVSIVE